MMKFFVNTLNTFLNQPKNNSLFQLYKFDWNINYPLSLMRQQIKGFSQLILKLDGAVKVLLGEFIKINKIM